MAGLRTLWWLYVAFIVYGTLIPFTYCNFEGCVTQNVAKIAWTPFVDPDGTRASIPDVVQNVLFFLPFGFLGLLANQRRNALTLASISLFGSLLSSLVESAQLMTTDRVSSITDVITNTSGAFLGAIVALFCLKLAPSFFASSRFQSLREDRHAFLVLTAGGVVAAGSLEPFNFTLDVGIVWSNIKFIFRDPLYFSWVIRDELVVGLRFFLFSAIFVYWFRELKLTNFFLKGFACSCLFGLFLEASQLIIQSRQPSAQDALLIVFTSFLGASFIVRKARITTENPFPVLWGLGIISFTWISAAVQTFSPFQIAYEYRSFNWIPFLAYYERTSFVALSNFIESMLIYFPMGFILQAISKKQRICFSICLLSLVISSSLEFPQGWIEGRYPDITDIIGALAGTIGACWLCIIYKRTYWPEVCD